ncbi:nucleotidyl transferase AbiEii/AbiGii toxin family protein [uncultured Friedmanniella sp.]|uniref:nucleotidyl transferase AbiEii/AbiGii toxin family protein n=1 Tax=uncultured Friedmanniella sp. TaxID=335381 RepID=UPI0035CC49B5
MPRGAAGPGREAALVDIAQDLLLRELAAIGLLDEMAFKGGTSLRKLYAGTQGRFSLDLDFSVAEVGSSAEDLLELLVEYVDGLQLGPFDYGIRVHRGKRHLLMSSAEFGQSEQLDSKIDVSAPPWLPPIRRAWVPMMVHRTYGDPPLPHLLTRAAGGEPGGEDLPAVSRDSSPRRVRPCLGREHPAAYRAGSGPAASTARRAQDLDRRLRCLRRRCAVATRFAAVPFEPDRWLAPRRPAD